MVVMSANIPTPRFKKVMSLDDLEDGGLRYPLFVKLCTEGSSKGVRLDSKVRDRGSLEKKTRWLLETYGPPVLVEEFVSGPEFTVGILGNEIQGSGDMQIEIKRTGSHSILWRSSGNGWKVRYRAPWVDPALQKGSRLWRPSLSRLECRDVLIDIRVSEDGTPYFLEINFPVVAGPWRSSDHGQEHGMGLWTPEGHLIMPPTVRPRGSEGSAGPSSAKAAFQRRIFGDIVG
jgi:D-alanine-D-alanine ligase